MHASSRLPAGLCITTYADLNTLERENPHAVVECNFQHRFSVNVWCGALHNYLIGPHFIERRLTPVQYRNFLQHKLPLLLEDEPLALIVRIWIQHDGAPPHYGREVTTYLSRKFRGRWIGRGGPVTWPPHSPDLSPLDLFVWGLFRSIVYRRGKPETREQLVARIQDAFEGLRNDFPRFSWQDSMDRRLKQGVVTLKTFWTSILAFSVLVFDICHNYQ
jgi:hypothetical protein